MGQLLTRPDGSQIYYINSNVFINGNVVIGHTTDITSVSGDLISYHPNIINNIGNIFPQNNWNSVNILDKDTSLLGDLFNYDECPICLEIAFGIDSKQLPCEHIFHKYCINAWTTYKNNNCPICRLSLTESREGSLN